MRCRPWSKGAAGPGARRQGARWRCRRRSSGASCASSWWMGCAARRTCGPEGGLQGDVLGAGPAAGGKRADDRVLRRVRHAVAAPGQPGGQGYVGTIRGEIDLDLGGAPRIARFRAYADGDAWGEGTYTPFPPPGRSGCMWRWSRPARTRPSRACAARGGGHPQWRLALPAGDAAAAFALSGREERPQHPGPAATHVPGS